MKKHKVALAVGLSGLFIAVGAFGQPGDEVKKDNAGAKESQGQGGRPGMMENKTGGDVPLFVIGKILGDPKMSADLGVPEDKLKVLKESMEQGQKQADEFRSKMQEIDQARKKLMDDNSTDENALIAVAEKMSQLRLEMEKTRIRQLLLTKKTLTPDQMAKVKEKGKEMMAAHMKNMREGKEGDHKGKDKPEKPAGQ